jgi:hypothetical protein
MSLDDHSTKDRMGDKMYVYQLIAPFMRFAMLLQSAPAMLPQDDEDAASRSTRFQELACTAFDWPDVARPYWVMAAFLTQKLVLASTWSFEKALNIDVDAFKWVATEAPSRIADDIGRLRVIWMALANSMNGSLSGTQNVVIGSRIVGRMITASVARAEGLYSLGAPHVDDTILAMNFNLPIVRIGNQYYIDDDLGANPDMTPDSLSLTNAAVPMATSDLVNDCVSIAALHPIVGGETDCGLIDPVTREPNCVYAAAGAGCPQIGLTPQQERARSEKGVYNWCHWTHAVLRTGVAPPELREAWIKRWKTPGERQSSLRSSSS